MRPVLTGIAAKQPCLLYYPIFVAAAAQITRQAPDIPGLENTKIMGSSALMAPGFLEAAGDAAVGFEFTNVDTTAEAMGEKYPEFVEAYEAKFGEAPIQAFHANAYDGAQILIAGDREGCRRPMATATLYIGRKALRDALFATKGYEGISGLIECDEHGQCAGFKFAVYRSPMAIRRPSRSVPTPRRSTLSRSQDWPSSEVIGLRAGHSTFRVAGAADFSHRDTHGLRFMGPDGLAGTSARLGEATAESAPDHLCRRGPAAAAPRGRRGGGRRHHRHPHQGHLHQRAVVRPVHVRPDHRGRLWADRARLHDGLRHPAADQLRPRRHHHDRRLRGLLPGPVASTAPASSTPIRSWPWAAS